jgi:hypothetical protein
LNLSRLVAHGKRQEQATLKLNIPHCARCAQLTKSVFLMGCVPFAAGGLLVGLAGFAGGFVLAVRLGLDEVDTEEVWPSLLVGAAAGLFAGLIGAFLAELAARLVLLPFYGRALLGAPLLTAQFLGSSDYVAGLTGRLAPDARYVELRFANDAVAQEFLALNAARA